MSLIQDLINFILNIDKHLVEIINDFGSWSYAILFAIIFVETGLVIFPFLPGDSLLFASGTLAAIGAFNINIVLIVFFVAAVVGDTVNYHIGHKVGKAIVNIRFLNKFINEEKIEQAEAFFNKHGGKTIVIARFIPLIRTFIPFIAGSSRMNYKYFLIYNIVGAIIWVGICTMAGYLFGNIPIIKDNFSIVVILIIIVSILPAIGSFFKNRKNLT